MYRTCAKSLLDTRRWRLVPFRLIGWRISSHDSSALFTNGGRVFWVCPSVEESEALDVAAAQDRFLHLQEVFGDKVGLVHGKMKSRNKDSAMTAFAEGETQILVATTVIEVGIDIPQATIMVIEHAERFGLAQLHQLRSRIGRGGTKSSCLLLYRAPLGETAKARIAIMRETEG